ncbi:hypothetical protein [Geothermobacter ehrlichii]|nr:hypothetical protein [Geothermobacter ehrlichii]
MGFYYPRLAIKGFGHHQFAEQFTPKRLKNKKQLTQEEHKTRQSLLKEIKCCIEKYNVILSSEAFQNCDPQLIKKVVGIYNPIIIVYLREQTGYLISSYAQAIQNTDLTLTIEQYERQIFRAHYDQFLEKWEEAFGRRNLIVRVYDRNMLEGNDIITDFMTQALRVDASLLERISPPTEDQNPSLGCDLIEYKRLLNLSGVPPSRELYQAFRTLATTYNGDRSPMLSLDLYNVMINKYKKCNKRTSEIYLKNGMELKFREQSTFPTETIDNLDRKKIEELTEKLIQILPNIKIPSTETLIQSYTKKS